MPLRAASRMGWSAAVPQQARKPIMMTRIYTGADGLTHSEKIEMKLTPNGTSSIKATSAEFSSRPAAPAGDWHTGPRRQFVITLSGRAEVEVANGQTVPIQPGNTNLIEATRGKGHITHNNADRTVVT